MQRSVVNWMARGAVAVFAAAVVPAAVTAQDDAPSAPRDVRRLGGATALYGAAVPNVEMLHRLSSQPRITARVRSVLDQAGVGHLSDRILSVLTSGTVSAASSGPCVDTMPADGTLVECEVLPGETLPWMAFNRSGTPVVMRNVRWAGPAPFRAFLLRVTDGGRAHSFVVPMDCGNVSLLRTESVAPPPSVAAVTPPPATEPSPTTPTPADTAPRAVPPPTPDETSPSPTVPPTPPSVRDEPPVDTTQRVTSPTPPSGARPVTLFVDGLFGKDRRVRPRDTEGSLAAGEFAQCSPMFGAKFGVARRFESDWELAGTVGVGFSVVRAESKVREHVLFAEVEGNRYLAGRSFVGVGFAMWDVTRSDTVTPALMAHVGVPLMPASHDALHLLIEGRLFFDNIDDVANNYQFWGGVRFRF